MKVLKSNSISAFGGLNFVIEEFDKKRLGKILNENLPKLSAQSQYDWKDLLYSFWSVFFCGGDCAEDLSGNFKPNLSQSPKLKVPSPDRVLNRLKELAEPTKQFSTKRGSRQHEFAINDKLTELNLIILNHLSDLSRTKVDLDYDNTICYTEKKDAQYTYKKSLGYIPGVALVGSNVVYIENRNGRSNASVLQHETLERMFEQLENQSIKTNRFRADSASYEFLTIKTIEKYTDKFYVRARMSSSMDKAISSVKDWEIVGEKEDEIYRGEASFTPFKRAARDHKMKDKLCAYRYIITKEKRKDGQINSFTNEACLYSIIVTNDWLSTPDEIVFYYNKRGAIEKEFEVLKYDFGWQKLPFSTLGQNQVYLQIMAICRNLYHYIITLFSKKVKGLKSNYRIKKFIFRFIAIPAKWVYRSRQWYLRIYGTIDWKT
ncbi:MAG TPA: IS1380 family transposase [Flavobacteriaceae bacterium]|nr:IS1380 family transposase [Flavobacteriaceae bacterium]